MVSYSLEKLGCPILSLEGQAEQRLGMKAIFNGRMSTYRYTKAWGQCSVRYFTYSDFPDISLNFCSEAPPLGGKIYALINVKREPSPMGRMTGLGVAPVCSMWGGGGPS